MRAKIALLASVLVTASCAGKMTHRKVTDEDTARGIRYFDSASYELQVFRRDDQGGTAVFVPVGEPQVVQIADTSKLMEADYEGKPFGSVKFQIDLNDNGTLKQAILTNSGKGAAAAVSSANSALEAIRDYDKTKRQTEIDELQREIDLIKKRQELDDLKNQPPPEDDGAGTDLVD